MTNVEVLTLETVKAFKSQKTGSFFINGAPGSGGSFALARFVEVLPIITPRKWTTS